MHHSQPSLHAACDFVYISVWNVPKLGMSLGTYNTAKIIIILGFEISGGLPDASLAGDHEVELYT